MAHRPPSLGAIPGLVWDPERRRYFPAGRVPKADGPSAQVEALAKRLQVARDVKKAKRRKVEVPVRNGVGRLRRRDVEPVSVVSDYYSRLDEFESIVGCTCGKDTINWLQSLPNGSWAYTGQNGQLAISDGEDTTIMELCRLPFINAYFDYARSRVYLLASAGDRSHVHVRTQIQVDTESHVDWDEIDIPHTPEVFGSSFHQDGLFVGSQKRLVACKYGESENAWSTRRTTSDPLALHGTANDVWLGLRNGSVMRNDMRDKSRPTLICKTTEKKAIINIRRLDDGAVPYGLAVSGMENELSIYDVRLGSTPLHRLAGHVNPFLQHLGWAFSPDDKHIFAAGSDRRIGLWSTVTGARIDPVAKAGDAGQAVSSLSNPLGRVFEAHIRAMSVGPTGVLDVAAGSKLYRFGRARGENGQNGQDGQDGEDSEGESLSEYDSDDDDL